MRAGEFRVGLVGCGLLAERGYVPALRRARGLRLVAVADPVAERRERIAAGLPSYPGAVELVAAQELDGLVLATPASTHLDDARLAAAAGLAALVEKPPAADADEAAALAGLDPLPAIGFNQRFDPDLRRLRAAVPADTPIHLTIDLHHQAGSWRSYVVDDDALLRLGPHLLDLARWLTGGELERVRALELTPAAAVLELEGDRGTARISCATEGLSASRIAVRGEDGGLIGTHTGAPLMRRLPRRLAGGDALVRCLVPQLTAFAERARGRPQPLLATAVDGLAVMRVVDAARRSAADGGAWSAVDAPVSVR
jgi:myo-inositol 2-dehydrogenase/D-chiro-inositol 1-dehydrogenase